MGCRNEGRNEAREGSRALSGGEGDRERSERARAWTKAIHLDQSSTARHGYKGSSVSILISCCITATNLPPYRRPGARPGGSPPPSVPHDRLVFLLLALVVRRAVQIELYRRLLTRSTMLQGSKVVATVKGRQRFSGILSAATADGEVNLALRQAQLVDDPSSPLRPSLLIQAKDLQELSAVDISLDSRPSERDAFKTDTEVTGLASDRKEKELQAWGAGADYGGAGGIEDGGLGGLDDEQRGQGGAKAWDQFATNERLYGTRTDYHEELYTTKLDRSGADYRQREQRAAQLEREILKVRFLRSRRVRLVANQFILQGGGGALANNAHIAEERGVVDDSGLTEEDRYVLATRHAFDPG
jgi:hypothetical protein